MSEQRIIERSQTPRVFDDEACLKIGRALVLAMNCTAYGSLSWPLKVDLLDHRRVLEFSDHGDNVLGQIGVGKTLY